MRPLWSRSARAALRLPGRLARRFSARFIRVHPPADATVVPLWPRGAPGSEGLTGRPEEVGPWWVKGVHAPSLTAFFPSPALATGASVILLPGGGHQQLVVGPEGFEPARFLARHGVAAFVLKYRLAQESGSRYCVEVESAADAARAVRWVRAEAPRLGLDPRRVGVWGWSAGAEVAHFVSFGEVAGDAGAVDPLDRASARPDFHIGVYPGPLGLPSRLPPDSPPGFLVGAFDDTWALEPILTLGQRYREIGVPLEVHLYERGGHGFNLGGRAEVASVRRWPERLLEWMEGRGLLGK